MSNKYSDYERLEFVLPLVTGEESDLADQRTHALAGMLIAGYTGRDAIDRAIDTIFTIMKARPQ